MTHQDPKAPDHLPAVYMQLGETIRLTTAIEDIVRSTAMAFQADASARDEYDDAILRVLLCVRLAPGGGIRAKDISIQMVKSTSHISRLIDRAESKGLVERQRDPNDRRAHQLVLTDPGREMIDSYAPHAVNVLKTGVLSSLDPDEIRATMAVLAKIQRSLDAFIAEPRSGDDEKR
jgi:DNA-binding MarR family transcriptional regulator